MQSLKDQIEKRRTFAIISHPDAGKTTLTEKLLLYSGMLKTAGMVKGRKNSRAAASDWMAMEQERGISITASAMQFPYKGAIINVLDTPGHQDFSEDTYRTLTAADCAIMVIDAAKGVEKQTRKLFEVCRLRGIPVMTFINKMDMPGKEPLDLLAEVEEVLGIHSSPMNWPIGQGKEFIGVWDRQAHEALIFTKTAARGAEKATIEKKPMEALPNDLQEELKDALELLDGAGTPYIREQFLAGDITPVFFASALTNFGVEPFFDAFIEMAPAPSKRAVDLADGEGSVDPVNDLFSGYVFKIQANMDPKHRDSMAFIRICSGQFKKDMTVKHHPTGREIRMNRPQSMLAGERTTTEEAVAGDVLGVINPGVFSIGDTISLKGGFNYKPLPTFQPELFARLAPKDTQKRKAFDKGIHQLCSEGAIQLLKPLDSYSEFIVAAVGLLQFEVMQHRLKEEYNCDTRLERLSYGSSAWIEGDLATFQKSTQSLIVKDKNDRPMILFNDAYEKRYVEGLNPHHTLKDLG
ncbi:MAG: peptide chain release factor 3 [Chlamydiia bacterium]|nr:peptide chain release factor 3 [Chlamydiia bacterium]